MIKVALLYLSLDFNKPVNNIVNNCCKEITSKTFPIVINFVFAKMKVTIENERLQPKRIG